MIKNLKSSPNLNFLAHLIGKLDILHGYIRRPNIFVALQFIMNLEKTLHPGILRSCQNIMLPAKGQGVLRWFLWHFIEIINLNRILSIFVYSHKQGGRSPFFAFIQITQKRPSLHNGLNVLRRILWNWKTAKRWTSKTWTTGWIGVKAWIVN